jgi:hypothetical protein
VNDKDEKFYRIDTMPSGLMPCSKQSRKESKKFKNYVIFFWGGGGGTDKTDYDAKIYRYSQLYVCYWIKNSICKLDISVHLTKSLQLLNGLA